MNRILFITLLALLPCVFTSLQAQGKLQGRVVSTDGEPVPYASVGVVSVATPYGTTTDNRGRYTLSINQTDSVTVRFSCTGFESQERRILIAAGATSQLDISLRPAAKQLDAVTVSDDRIRSSAFTQINIKRIENNVGPSQSVESIIKTLPDVNSNNELSSQYSVRGGSFDENLVYIDGVEIYRPQLVRSGQQEGLSIINPDLVDHITFSPGGFDATYGDRMSSVLDIIYSRPTEPIRRVSLSLLGGSASAQGTIGNRFSYAVGFRHHSNRYLFKSMDTEGNYSTAYTDLQAILRYRVNDSLDLSLLSVWTNNIYGLVPYTRTTTFGTFNQSLKLNVYFDGLEDDRYRTLLGAFTLNYHPNDDLQIQWINSALSNREQENYDIQSQYWLYAIGVGENAADTNQFDQGVGTFLEHARNHQDMTIFSSQLKMVRYALLGSWNFGLQAQLERTSGRLREWKWVDSADFAYPTDHHTPGLDDTAVFNPLLQLYCNAANRVQTLRGIAYVQRDINLFTRHDNLFRITAGLRGQYYNTRSDSAALNSQFLLSPRLSASFKPHSGPDLLYRLVAGIYQQPTLYRELRNPDGSLCSGVPAQRSYLASASIDWNLRLWDMPFRLTADFYYKYITHLIPYTIDNLRIRYNPSEPAVGYATGASLRINGDFVPGLESWASVSVMKTQEDLLNDNLGWLNRPTDQRFSFKIFVQDYLPSLPWWRMSLSFIYGTRTPTTYPNQTDRSIERYIPSYFRADWGNTIQLTRFDRIRRSRIGQLFDDISVTVEVFNLFDYHNVVSFIWVADYTNYYWAVPNYLTSRQFNIKLSATF